MTVFPFDATTGKTNWPSAFPDPIDFARYRWELLTKEPTFDRLEDACEWAAVDSAVYDELRNWALENKAELSEEARLMLFDVFVQERPKDRNQFEEKKRRNCRIIWIAKVLQEEYGLDIGKNAEPKQHNHVETCESISSILHKVGVGIDPRTIANFLYRARARKRGCV